MSEEWQVRRHFYLGDTVHQKWERSARNEMEGRCEAGIRFTEDKIHWAQMLAQTQGLVSEKEEEMYQIPSLTLESFLKT